jgi:lysophospholipase L1-like esterase
MIGDSLTEGIVGVNFIDKLKEMRPDDQFVNRGIGGDTLKNIINRLMRETQKAPYDLVVMTGGHNDLLLPYVRTRGPKWEQFTSQIIKGGAVLTESENEFAQNLVLLVDSMNHMNIPLILTTLNPLGENLDSELNKKRAKFNRLYRNLKNVTICDVALEFEDILSAGDSSDYLMNSLIKLVDEDPKRCEKGESMILSEERGLKLTIDGAHLNDRGAQIYARMLNVAISGIDI